MKTYQQLTEPEIPRTRYGSPLWPKDDRQAWFMLCDLARVAPDTAASPDELIERLKTFGEHTQRRTVERLHQAFGR